VDGFEKPLGYMLSTPENVDYTAQHVETLREFKTRKNLHKPKKEQPRTKIRSCAQESRTFPLKKKNERAESTGAGCSISTTDK